MPERERGSAVGVRMRILVASGLTCLGLAALAPAAGAAPVSVGHSGWFWGNPLPQGNTLSGLDFDGSRGYAAGAFGTLLRTDDAGASWTGVRTGLTQPLVRVRVIDANTVVVGGGCALRRSNDGGQSFSRLPWTASDANCPSEIASFHFPNASVGYLMTADGGVFKTDDGGQTFSRQTSVPGTPSTGGQRKPTDIFFVGDTTGIAITGGGGQGGKIFRTTDSGNSWLEVQSSSAELQGATFPTPTDGYVVGGTNVVFHSIDGGVSWTKELLDGVPPGLALSSVDCSSATACLIASPGGQQLVRTTDGGATGAAITAATSPLLAASFSSATRAVAVGELGTTVVSDDGGLTWSPVGGAIAGTDFRRLRASSAQIANAGAPNGVLARTVDGGQSWTTVGVPTTGVVIDASFATATVGYAIDSSGGAFKTSNGGTSWQILNPGAAAGLAGVLALDANNVLLIGPKGVRRSSNGGNTFEFVNDKDVSTTRLINAEPAGSAVFAYGGEALRISSDGGQTWKAAKLPFKKAKIQDADFVSAKTGFALATNGSLWSTRNGGKKWKELTAIGTPSGRGISFSSATEGYVTASRFGAQQGGIVYHTLDGGKSFQPQLVASEALSELWDAGATAFSATSAGSMFATTTGGQAGAASTLSFKQKGGKRPLAKPATKVKISGTLAPAKGGEQILISYRDRGQWRAKVETAASNGAFTSSFGVHADTAVVAQWLGDDSRAGAGTKVVRVKQPKPK